MMWLIAILMAAIASAPAEPCEPFIRFIDEDDAVVVEGACINPGTEHHNGEFRYELIVDRMGETGTTRSKQSGTFTPGVATADTLVRTRVSFSSGDELLARLIVLEGDVELGSKEIRRVLP